MIENSPIDRGTFSVGISSTTNLETKTLLVMEPTSSFWTAINVIELWKYRELFFFLALRDIQVRYKQAALGVAWAVLQPVFSMLIFTIFFGRLAKIPSDGVPYPVFSFLAMLPWAFFTSAVGKGSNSLVSSSNLLSKVYFPRIIVPSSAVMSGLADYLISFGLLLILMLYYGFTPQFSWLLTIPALTALTVLFALGLSLFLSAVNVKYRDVSHVVPFFLQLWMFATPVVYPLSLVPEKYKWLIRLNPMTGIIEGYRSLLPGRTWDFTSLGMSATVTILVFTLGLFYFRKVERSFADLV